MNSQHWGKKSRSSIISLFAGDYNNYVLSGDISNDFMSYYIVGVRGLVDFIFTF